MNVHIERASEADGPSILQLLREAGLPIDGLSENLHTAFVARDGADVVGCAALEVYADGVLLRSVAVASAARGHGLGHRLTDAAITLAQSLGTPAVFLLTTTAESYFPRFGFVPMPREQVPTGVQQSIEFRSACPSSAVVMGRTLRDEPEKPMTYTHGHHESVLRSHKWRTLDNSAAYLAPHLTPGTSVLDLGCGPGTITADIGRRVAPGRVLGIDTSAAVIEEARRDTGGGPNVEFSVGDLYALEMDDHTFDVVHAHQVLQHLPDPVRALREMKRVCKPGGLVAARDGDYDAFRWYPDEPAIDFWLALYRKIARRNAGEPDAGRFLLAWAHAAGFDNVQPGASVWCFATPDDRAWWGGLWADRMTESAIARQAVTDGLATEKELREIAEGWRRWAMHPDAWYAVLHGEILCRC